MFLKLVFKKFTCSFNKNERKIITNISHKNFFWSENKKEEIKSEENRDEKQKSIFGLDEATNYIEEKVKKFDFYAWVIANTLPQKYKRSYLSYHAFFVEILRSRYISKEPSVCRTRLCFWEESLKEVIQDKGSIKEPMLIVLKETIKTTAIRRDTLFRMIDFLYYDIEKNGLICTIEELEVFSENTRSLLIYLSLNLFQIDDRDAFIAASHLGRGIGIVDSLKKMPGLLKMNINQIPDDLICKYGASMINLWDRHGNIKDQFFDCILEVASYAKKHIEIGRSMKDKLPKNTHIAFLQAVESYEWLMELEKYNFDVLEPKLQKLSTMTIPKKMMEYGKKGEY
jgi:NADH dehydrogenase [ubiquinone] 1 alpha subcomplex assembly factor 6